jgi:hypothetical protein
MMENEFQISIMDTFVHQAKYMKDLMKIFNMVELKPVSTLMSTTIVLDPDENGETFDQREYMSMIGSLLYLTATRPYIRSVHSVYVCALSSFPTHFTSASHLANLQVSQIHTLIWDFVLCRFIT